MLAELEWVTPGHRWMRRPRSWTFCDAACSSQVSRLPFWPLEESNQFGLPGDYVDQLPAILSQLVGHAIKLLFRLRNHDMMLPVKYRAWLLDHNRLPDQGGRRSRGARPDSQHKGLHLRGVSACHRDLDGKGPHTCEGRSTDGDGIRTNASWRCVRAHSAGKLRDIETELRPLTTIRSRCQR